jgi:hypothetical protein
MSRPLDVDAWRDREAAALSGEPIDLKQESCETVHNEGHGHDDAAVRK